MAGPAALDEDSLEGKTHQRNLGGGVEEVLIHRYEACNSYYS